MAMRNIREMGDDILRKTSKPIREMTPRLRGIIEDMFDTMYETGGVGLAGPQIGILKRVFVIDVTEEQNQPFAFINPEILATDGSQTGAEGCLSIPGKHATVTRPNYVKVRAQNVDMKWFELEATELFARAICHEYDHLDGILYVDKKEGPLLDNEETEE